MTCLETSNVFDESRALFCVSQVLAGIFPVRGRWTKFASYGYVFLALSIYYSLFLYVREYATKVFLDLEIVIGRRALIRRVQFYLNLVYLPLLLVPNVNASWNLGEAYRRIDEADRTLRYLNIYPNSGRRTRKDVVHVCAILLTVTMANLMEYYSLYDHDRTFRYTLMWTLDRTPEFFADVSMCTFAVLLLKLRSRFAKVNKALGLLSRPEANGTISLDVNKAYRLKLLRSSHANLSKIAVLVNEAYGFQLLVTLAVSFLANCLHLRILCENFASKHDAVDVLTSAVWILFNAGKFAYITHICYATAYQAELTNSFVPECWTNFDNKFTDEAKGFFWYLLSSRLQFTFGRCYKIDYITLRTVTAGWVVASLFFFVLSSGRTKGLKTND